MPLQKYYCDYCDKQFQDTPAARKRHLQGIQHQRAKALWFASFPDASNQIHPDSFGKGICNRFVRTLPPSLISVSIGFDEFSGSCQFGDSCKYFHPKQNLQSINPQGVPENQLAGGGPLQGGTVGDSMGISLGNLPPSLKPPPEGGYPPLPFIDWG